MSTTEETRAFLTGLFQAWTQQGNPAPFVDALADDVTWTATGTSPISGVYRSKAAYADNVLRPLGERLESIPTLQLVRLLVEDDWAAAQLAGRGRGKRGEDYDMDYCWLIQVRDNQIRQVIGFFDTAKANALFAP